MSRLIDLADIAPLEMRPGSVIARRIEGQRITMAVFELQPGAVVPEHEHPAEQIGLCIRGSITFTVGDETRMLGPGGHVERPVRGPASSGGRPGGCHRRRGLLAHPRRLGRARADGAGATLAHGGLKALSWRLRDWVPGGPRSSVGPATRPIPNPRQCRGSRP